MEEEQTVTLPLGQYIRTGQTVERQAAEIYQLKDAMAELNSAARVIQLELDELRNPNPPKKRKTPKAGTK